MFLAAPARGVYNEQEERGSPIPSENWGAARNVLWAMIAHDPQWSAASHAPPDQKMGHALTLQGHEHRRLFRMLMTRPYPPGVGGEGCLRVHFLCNPALRSVGGCRSACLLKMIRLRMLG